MEMRMALILFFSIALILPIGAKGASEKDFVAQMMDAISSKPSIYQQSDYQQITVSPNMMESVLEMMSSNANHITGIDAHNQELYSKLLRNVKSLRVFMVFSNEESYKNLARQVINGNKRKYKAFKTNKKVEQNNLRRIWTRESGDRVVEIVMFSEQNERDKNMQILNLTGDFSNDFINLLLQMQ